MSGPFNGGGDRPWLALPNPLGFPSFGEQATQIHKAPPRSYSAPPKGSKLHQRTSPYGKDWLGVGFAKGDLILGTVSGDNTIFEVDEILLDDGKGQPYTSWSSSLVLDQISGQIFFASYGWQKPTELKQIDPTWIGNHLGLIATGNKHRNLPDTFEQLDFQSFRVRARPIDGGNKHSLRQEQVTVFGNQMDRNLLDLYSASKKIPFVGHPIQLGS